MKNILNQNTKDIHIKKIDWQSIQKEMKIKFGSDIYESWLRKIEFVDDFPRTAYGKIKRFMLK